MKFLSILLLLVVAATAGCSTTANNGLNAKLRGPNVNMGYVTNTETNVKPTIRVNAANITPGNMTDGNHTNTKSNANANLKMPTHNGN
jgi:hypothetical protein